MTATYSQLVALLCGMQSTTAWLFRNVVAQYLALLELLRTPVEQRFLHRTQNGRTARYNNVQKPGT